MAQQQTITDLSAVTYLKQTTILLATYVVGIETLAERANLEQLEVSNCFCQHFQVCQSP